MSLETIRLSQKAKDRLIVLKRYTGVTQWNILCRWALCRSLQEPTTPSGHEIKLDSNVEIAWSTFGGEQASVYLALLKMRCVQDGLELSIENLQDQLTAHMHRGINYLFTEIESVDEFLVISTEVEDSGERPAT